MRDSALTLALIQQHSMDTTIGINQQLTLGVVQPATLNQTSYGMAWLRCWRYFAGQIRAESRTYNFSSLVSI
jgi:hypothetical protein